LDATITLEYPDEKHAEAVANGVSPDNFKTPPGLSVKTIFEKTKVITVIQCDSKLATFTATIDDLLFSATTAERALKVAKKV
jgi:hypothetical protein